jgi:large subunit ribosomal protein L21
MYAVVSTGGKQYRVQKGDVLRVEKLPGDVGSPVSFDQVLLMSDGENVQIGQPVLEGVNVGGQIVEQGKSKKIVVFKYKRRKNYRRKQGHRQAYTAVKIQTIGDQDDDALVQKAEDTVETEAAPVEEAPAPVQDGEA